jgi:RimJ/RimL family protein N-acetyltransferase
VLRPYQRDDFEGFAALNADENVRRHVGGPLTNQMAEVRFETFLDGECQPGCEVWAITSGATGDYLGHCWLIVTADEQYPEMGFLIATRFWHRGFGTETAKVLLEYASTAGHRRIVATVDVDHVVSIRVLERVGMEREAELSDEEGRHYRYTFRSPRSADS